MGLIYYLCIVKQRLGWYYFSRPASAGLSSGFLIHGMGFALPVNQRSLNLQEPILAHVRRDFSSLRQEMTVQEALSAIRRHGAGEKIVYFYMVNEANQLLGVLPTRRLLTAPVEQRLADIMIKRVIAIPHTATVLEACELFVMHKFLAFPVVDEERHLVGIVDISLFTEEVFDLAEREQTDAVFESLGFRVSQVRDASPFRSFRFRFPWLLAAISGGTICALLTSVYEVTLSQYLMLAFFMALVLGLGESVSVQSMTVAIQALRTSRPTLRWYAEALRREVTTSLLLGGACGSIVALIVWAWRGDGAAAWVIGLGIVLSMCAACVFGLSIPSLLHALRLDPKIAAGPVTLALTDILTLVFYFTLAVFMLG